MDFPQATPPSYPPPLSGQPRGHPSVGRDSVFSMENAAGNLHPDENWVDMPQPIDNIAGRPQHLQYADVGYYDIANDHPPLQERLDPAINNYAGTALDVPAQAQAAQPDPVDIFANAALNAANGPAQAFLGEWLQQDAIPNVHVNEVLRQLAIVYLHDPNSQIAVIRMEPGPGQAHAVRVHITLDIH